MFKFAAVLKFICCILFASMLMAAACDPIAGPGPDEDTDSDSVSITEAEIITKEDIQEALDNANLICHNSVTVDEFGTLTYYFTIELSDSESFKIKGKKIKITKSEFYIDNVLVETKHSEYDMSFSYSTVTTTIHQYEIRVYAATTPENEVYRSIKY